MRKRVSRAVSPVVAVILMVAVTVILSAVIGTFVLQIGSGLEPSNNPPSVKFDETDIGVSIQFVSGSETPVDIVYRGEVVRTVRDPSAGDSILIPAAKGETVTLVSDGEVISTYSSSSSSSLAGYWTMDSQDLTTNQTKIRERSGYAPSAKIEGNVTTGWNAPLGTAVKFDGNDSKLRHNNSRKVSQAITSESFAISFYIYPKKTTSTGWADYMSFWNTNSRIELKDPDYSWGGLDTINAQWYNNSFSDMGVGMGHDLNTKAWNHVVFQYTGTSFEVYVNGTLINSNQGIYDTHDDASGGFWVRGSTNTTWRLSDLRIYDRHLSKSEIESLYNSTTSK